jgi:hypothetical protein
MALARFLWMSPALLLLSTREVSADEPVQASQDAVRSAVALACLGKVTFYRWKRHVFSPPFSSFVGI